MAILTWIIIGGFAGWAASMITDMDEKMGVGANVIVGILGALIGGWGITLFGGTNIDLSSFSVASFAVAIIGSIVLLALVRSMQKPLER